MLKRKLLAAALLFGAVGGAQATTAFTFDYNGAGAGGTVSGVTTIDQTVGNALAVGGNPAGGLQTGNTVTLLYQANLGILTDGTNILYAQGTGGSFFTFVAGFNETATVTLNGNIASATFTSAGGPSFFNMYATSANGDNFTGAGFTSATPILSGHLSSVVSGSFTQADTAPTDGNPDTAIFDQAGTNNYPGITTVVGSGSTDLNFIIDSYDAAYFPDVNFVGALLTMFVNSSLVDPFKQVDPSQCFSSDGITSCNLLSNIGSVNGLPVDGVDRNFQFQADANASLTVSPVPEPGSLALLGLGLGLCGAMLRRRT